MHLFILTRHFLSFLFSFQAFEMASSDNIVGSDDVNTGFIKVILIDIIFQQVQEFLVQNKTDVNNMLNVSKKFLVMKKSEFYWKLNKEFSLEYYYNFSYRSRLDSLLSKANTQLSLNLVRRIDISDVSTLSNVHTLDISYCYRILDVSALANVHTIDMSYCVNISDLSALGNVHTLDISCCFDIRDVSALGNVHTLNISHCELISDVSALGNVHTLDMSHCDAVSDVSALGNVYSLDISGCDGISDVSALINLHTLKIRQCRLLSDVRALGNVVTLIR
jgi:hypothetical protein